MTDGDFIVERFPVRREADAFHSGRKLFVDSFLSGMKPMSFIAAGNCLRIVSYPA